MLRWIYGRPKLIRCITTCRNTDVSRDNTVDTVHLVLAHLRHNFQLVVVHQIQQVSQELLEFHHNSILIQTNQTKLVIVKLTIRVQLDRPDQKELQEPMELMESQEYQEWMDKMLKTLLLKHSNTLDASIVHKDLQDHLDHKENQEFEECEEHVDKEPCQEETELQDNQEHLDQSGQLVQSENQETMENQERMLNIKLEFPDLKEFKDQQEKKETKDHKERLEQLEFQEHQEKEDQEEIRVMMERMERLEFMEKKESQELMQNTVNVHKDKKQLLFIAIKDTKIVDINLIFTLLVAIIIYFCSQNFSPTFGKYRISCIIRARHSIFQPFHPSALILEAPFK